MSAVTSASDAETATLRRLDRLAWIMDAAFALPGTNRRFGVDALLSLIPGLGSFLGAFVSGYLVLEAVRLRVPGRVLRRMLRNLLLDWLLGEVPVLGAVFDLFYKANEANAKLLREALTLRRKQAG